VSARVGAIIVVLTGTVTFFNAGNANTDSVLLSLVPYVGVPAALALAAFIVPLYGTHGRLVAEKRRLEAIVDDRLERLMFEVGSDVDARRFTGIDQQSKAVGYVLQERDIVAKLSTWPWSTGTVRGLATAILFPLGLFLLQRVILTLL
jgi:hypothetical protein